MQKISSFKIAAGMLGIATLVKVSAFAIAVAILGLATSAQASGLGRPCTAAAQNQWLSLAALQSKVEALGYTVKKAELKHGCGELRAIDTSGNRVELYVDPSNGQIVGRD